MPTSTASSITCFALRAGRPSRSSGSPIPSMAMASVIMVQIWKLTPVMFIVLLAALQNVPKELHEAAELDGAGPMQRFRYVTFPVIRPTSVIITLLASIWTFQSFDIVYLLTGGGPADATEILPTLIYQKAFWASEIGYAAALGMLMLVCLVILSRRLPLRLPLAEARRRHERWPRPHPRSPCRSRCTKLDYRKAFGLLVTYVLLLSRGDGDPLPGLLDGVVVAEAATRSSSPATDDAADQLDAAELSQRLAQHRLPRLFLEQLQGRGDLHAAQRRSCRCTRPTRSRASSSPAATPTGCCSSSRRCSRTSCW